LGVQFEDDGSAGEIEFIYGSNFPLFSELDFYYRGGPDAHYYVDQLSGEGSELLFISDDGFQRMFLNENDTYKTISSSIVMGALSNGANLNRKPYLISEIVDCFLDSTLISTLPEVHTTKPFFNLKIYPNPFSDFCTIDFDIEYSSDIRVEVFNGSGQRVNILFDGFLHQGTQQLLWVAKDSRGQELKPGIYLLIISSEGRIITNCMILN